MERREKNTGFVVFVKDGRKKPYIARISIGYDKEENLIKHDLGSFEKELQALVCLENYHTNPHPIEIKESKYNQIVIFSKKPYPLVPVTNPKENLEEKTKKDNYTYSQLYAKFKEFKMLTTEESKIEKKYKIRPTDKPFSRTYCNGFRTAFNNSKKLHDRIWKELRPSDFIKHLKECGKSKDTQKQMINLWNNLDKFAMEEDIIEKGYSQFIPNTSNKKEIKSSKNQPSKKEKVFSYEQIEYLWKFKPKQNEETRYKRMQKEKFVRDYWLMLLYTGMRADELLSIYTTNIFLDDNYFIGGLKTEAGINREIPIHPDIKHLFEKYYNPNNEFLFIQPNGNKIDYDYYLYHYKYNFKDFHPNVSEHTAHDARHTLRTELQKLNIKEIIINSIIGHSNEDIGRDIYTHISIEEKIEAIKKVTYKKTNNLYIFDANYQEKTS